MSTDLDDHVLSASTGRSAVTAGYRYPGSPPFQDTDLDRQIFRGRAKEADTVLQSILSTNLHVLYSVSGLGKSSLLNAGVMHRLRARGHWPVSVRVNDPTRPIVGLIRKQIEMAARADPTIELTEDPGVTPAISESTLWNMLASLEVWRRNELQQLVVVFDQFEELFTLGWSEAERRAFIEQFGEVLRGFPLDRSDESGAPPLPPPRVKFVIVIREDSLGELETLSRDVPQIMDNRFRLEPLRLEQAEAAIREPALLDDTRLGTQRFEYTEAASGLILEFLRTRTVRGTVVHSDSVDPCQMQIVCQYVERTILPRKSPFAPGAAIEIDAEDLGGRAGLEGVLRHFYQRTVRTFPVATQRAVRDLCENGLINKSRRRLSLDEEEIGVRYRVLPADLEQLVDERLLRADQRLDSVYYEIAHDTLIDPILDFRDEQRAQAARRRARSIRIAAFVAAAVALLVVAMVVVRRGDDGPEHRQLGLGASLTGVVDPGGRETIYELAAPAGSISLVTVTPVDPVDAGADPVDVAIELSAATGATRQEDRGVDGQAERIVVPTPEYGEAPLLRVISLNSASGPFTIAAETLEVTDVTPGVRRVGRIADPGDVEVYRLQGGEPTSMVVDVVPSGADPFALFSPGPVTSDTTVQVPDAAQSQKEAKAPTELDGNIEIIDPSGATTDVDSAGPGEMERFALTGSAGSYLVVVKGYQATVGDFALDVSETTPLLAGDPRRVPLALDTPVNVAFEAADDAVYLLRVTPEDGIGVNVAILRPDEAVMTLDSAYGDVAAIIAGLPGQYVASVSGYPPGGAFDIELEAVEPTTLPVGTSLTAATGDVLTVEVGSEPVILVADPHADLDPMLRVMDPDGTTRTLDARAGGEIEARALVGEGSYMIHVTDYAGDSGSTDVVAVPAARAVPLSVDRTATGVSPAVFDVDVDGDDPLVFSARPGSPDGRLDIQVVDPDGFPIVTDLSGQAGPDGATTATVGGVRPGTYHVVVTSSVDQDEVTGSLSTIRTLTEGASVTFAGPGTFFVELGPDEMSTVTADSADSSLAIAVVGPQGDVSPTDLGALGAPPGEPVTSMVGGAGPGVYQVRVDASGEAGEITLALRPVTVQALAPGGTVTAGATSAVFDVDVENGRPLELTAGSTSPTGVLGIQVITPSGYSLGDIATDLQQPLRAELPDDVAALLPPEVVELFADGLPPTVEEAVTLLTEAGQLDAVLAVLQEHPEAAAALFDTPSPRAGAPATAVVGGSGPGTYRVIVTSTDLTSDVTVTADPIQVQLLTTDAPVVASAPAAFDVDITEGSRVLTAVPDSEAIVEIEVVDVFGQVAYGSTSPSSSPGRAATAIIGGSGFGTYHVTVTSTSGGTITVQLE